MSDLIIPVNAWEPCTPETTSTEGLRSPDILEAVIAQFDVVHNPRYTPHGHTTFCNILLTDVSSAMGCIIPHWVDENGVPVAVGKGHELSANGVCDWLANCGPIYGWNVCQANDALMAANMGQPAVITWKNPTGASGHVAMCYPTPPDAPVMFSAQAGATNFVAKPYTEGFGHRTVIYYRHL